MSILRIDAHHHLWRYDSHEFGWLDDHMAALRRDFLVVELERVLQSAGVRAAVSVQARQSLSETQFLLDCAHESESICAVVGWVPLQSENVASVLDEFADKKKFVGVREIVQGQPEGFLNDPSFNRGVKELTARDLAYDVLIYENQLEEAAGFVRRHANQRFVLDHAAKPKIALKELDPWRTKMKDLARSENTWCKLSGLVTEASWLEWTLEDLRPYLDVCVEVFGTCRLMAGSDWPVCLVATEYAHWWDVLEEYFAPFSEDERKDVFGESALRFYRVEGELS